MTLPSPVAQLAEQVAVNHLVWCSNHHGGANWPVIGRAFFIIKILALFKQKIELFSYHGKWYIIDIEADMTKVTIPVSDSILTSLNMEAEEIALSMRKEFALKSFRDGKLTLAQGANFCGMNIYDFISCISQAGIPVIDYSIEDVDRELVQLNANC